MVVAVLLGSVRQERMGGRAAAWVLAELRRRGHEAILVDAAALELPILDRMWKEIKDSHDPRIESLHTKLASLAELYARTDGFCVVSAEYNHSVPPGLSNLIDYFLEEYFWRPSAIVCYSAGSYGGVRAAIQLRALLTEAGMPSIPSLMPIPSIAKALDAEGKAQSEDWARGSIKFFEEFDWYMTAFKAQRQVGVPY